MGTVVRRGGGATLTEGPCVVVVPALSFAFCVAAGGERWGSSSAGVPEARSCEGGDVSIVFDFGGCCSCCCSCCRDGCSLLWMVDVILEGGVDVKEKREQRQSRFLYREHVQLTLGASFLSFATTDMRKGQISCAMHTPFPS